MTQKIKFCYFFLPVIRLKLPMSLQVKICPVRLKAPTSFIPWYVLIYLKEAFILPGLKLSEPKIRAMSQRASLL